MTADDLNARLERIEMIPRGERSAINTGSLGAFFQQWDCTPEERNLLVLYLAVVRLKAQMDSLAHFITWREMKDGEGI